MKNQNRDNGQRDDIEKNSKYTSESLIKHATELLNSQYVVIGKKEIRSWHGWLIIGIAVGIFSAIFIRALIDANRSNIEILNVSAASRSELLASEFIRSAERWKPAMLETARRRNFMFPKAALDAFDTALAGAKQAYADRHYQDAINLAGSVKGTLDFLGTDALIRGAESFRVPVLNQVKLGKISIPQIALDASNSFLAQAKTVYGAGNYPDAKRLANLSKESIDYFGAQHMVKITKDFQVVTVTRAKNEKFSIPQLASDNFNTIIGSAKIQFANGDYLNVKKSAGDAHDAIDYQGARQSIAKADAAKRNAEIEASRKRTTVPPDVLANFELLKSQAETAFGQGDYRETRRLALLAAQSFGAPAVVVAPVISPNGGTFTDVVLATLETATAGAEIRYTTDGTTPTPASTLYHSPFPLSDSVTLTAKAFSGANESQPSSAVFRISITLGAVEAPTINPNGGTFTGSVSIVLSTPTAGADIYYTTNGTVPSAASNRYAAPFALTSSATLKAKALLGANATNQPTAESSVATAVFTINPPSSGPPISTPTINPNGGTFSAPVSVTFNTTTPGTQLRYTTDGTEPNSASALYLRPLRLTGTATVKVKAFRQGYTESVVASAQFNLNLAAVPVANTAITAMGSFTTLAQSPLKVLFTSPVTAKLETATPGATILYTTDGSTPREGAPLTKTYAGPFTVSKATVVKAKAVKAGVAESEITNAAFIDTRTQSQFTGVSSAAKFYGEQKTAIILARWAGSPEWTRSDVETQAMTDPDSFDGWWRTMSGGLVWHTYDVYGWYTLPGAPCSGQGNIVGLAQADGYDPAKYQRQIIAFPDLCGAGGTAGSPGMFGGWIDGGVILTGSHSAVHSFHDNTIGTHTREYYCGLRGISGPCIPYTSTANQVFSSDFDVMGDIFSGPENVHAGEREHLGWLPPERVQEVTQDGTYKVSTISAKEPPQDGSKLALKIRAPSYDNSNGSETPAYFYVQYRTAINSDMWLSSYPGYVRGAHIYLTTAGIIHETPSEGLGFIRKNYKFDLGMETPFNTRDSAMKDGQTVYDDANNITITQLSHDAASVTLQVKFGPPPCVRFSPQFTSLPSSLSFSVIEPSPQSGQAGSALDYLLKSGIFNADLKTCSPTTFSLSGVMPPQLSAIINPSSIAIPAGSASTFAGWPTVKVASSPTAPLGSYNFQVRVQDSANPSRSVATTNAEYRVTSPGGTGPAPRVMFGEPNNIGQLTALSGQANTIPVQVVENVTRVDLLVDNVLVSSLPGTAGPATYRPVWNTTAVANGRHTLTVKATNALGAVGQASRDVAVSNPLSSGANLIVRSIALPAQVAKGVPMQVGVQIMNNGSAISSPARVRFYPNLTAPPTFSITSPVPDQNIGPLEPGTEGRDEQFLTFNFTPTTAGVVYVVIDNGDPGASGETLNSIEDNTGSWPYQMYQLPLPEFSVKSLSAASNLQVGQQSTANVIVKINPYSTASHLRVRFYPELPSPPTFTTASPVLDQFIDWPAPSDTATDYWLSFNFTPASAGSKTAYAVVDNGDPGAVDEIDDSLASNSGSVAYTVAP